MKEYDSTEAEALCGDAADNATDGDPNWEPEVEDGLPEL